MRTIRLAAIAALFAIPALASPQGDWPEEMRGASLPRQPWIMVIPATRLPDGSISVWNRSDAWNREWIVPKATPTGMRTVAINGDSEDSRIVSVAQIDNMSVAALSKLASKYGAGAIAVVVAEENEGVAVAAWSKGNYATWDAAEVSNGQRQGALDALDRIFSGKPGQSPSTDPQLGRMGEALTIAGQRFDHPSGTMQYRLTGGQSALDKLAENPSFTVHARNGSVPPSIDISVVDGRDVEEALSEAGLFTAP